MIKKEKPHFYVHKKAGQFIPIIPWNTAIVENFIQVENKCSNNKRLGCLLTYHKQVWYMHINWRVLLYPDQGTPLKDKTGLFLEHDCLYNQISVLIKHTKYHKEQNITRQICT